MNKKLQVFVSSTYTDLIEERQAAVEAILDAGHIPAGMELFKAGKSQMKTIRKWIDESDVYMLILGGRYGSIEEESGLSYTELEYRYALSKNMPVFAIVLSDNFLEEKITSLGLKNVIEQIATDKYQSFKSLVMAKIIREVNDCKDIKIAIHSTLNEFIHDCNLTGWIRNTNELIESNRILQKGNKSLNEQLQKTQKELTTQTKEEVVGNFYYNDLVHLLNTQKFDKTNINVLSFFIDNYKFLCENSTYYHPYASEKILFSFLEKCRLVESTKEEGHYNFKIAPNGITFYSKLQKHNDI